jgi:hypothetical protein
MVNGLSFRRRSSVVTYLADITSKNAKMYVDQNMGPIGGGESGWVLRFLCCDGFWDSVAVRYEEQGRMNGMGERALYKLMADVKRERGDS